MALQFFYKGEHFADEFDDVLIPTFGPLLSANWTIEDYGQTITYLMCGYVVLLDTKRNVL